MHDLIQFIQSGSGSSNNRKTSSRSSRQAPMIAVLLQNHCANILARLNIVSNANALLYIIWCLLNGAVRAGVTACRSNGSDIVAIDMIIDNRVERR